MSNPLSLQATKFTNLPSQTETFGFRIYDNYDSVYDNTMEEVPAEDLTLLALVLQEYADNETVSDMLSHTFEQENGMNINGNWYDYDDIKEIMENHYN